MLTLCFLQLLLMENLSPWLLVFGIFLVEMTFCTIIVVPGPIQLRTKILQELSKLWNEYPRFRLATKIVMVRRFLNRSVKGFNKPCVVCLTFLSSWQGLLGLLFLDSLRRIYYLYDATSIYGTTSHDLTGKTQRK